MNVNKLDGNWNNTSQKPEDDATIFVAVGVSARFGGGYRVEAAVYDAENDCITLLSSYKGGEDFDIWKFWKYADENTMHGRYRALHAAIAKYKEEFRRINNLFQQLAVSADEAFFAMKQFNKLAKTIGPYSKEELQLRRINGKRKKIWKH